MVFRLMTDSEIAHWYEAELSEAFAPQERKPFADIVSLRAAGRYEIWGLFDAGALLGYGTLWKAPEHPLVLLDYLGVTALRRNGGLGSRLLTLLKGQGRPLVVESELPVPGASPEENDIRRRRIGFYQRGGFSPAYEMATCGMAWQALLYDPTQVPLSQIMAAHRAIYGPLRTDVQVPLTHSPALPYWMEIPSGQQ